MISKSATISGRVIDKTTGAGLAGVVVSDGRSVVLTDKKGKFTLTVGKRAKFVFVSSPGQYQPAGKFYQEITAEKVSGPLEFQLVPHPVGESFYFGQLTDVHLNPTPEFKKFATNRLQPEEQYAVLTGAAREIAAIRPSPQFIVVTGDFAVAIHACGIEEAKQKIAFYMRACAEFELPTYNVIGNHDQPFHVLTPEEMEAPEYGRGLFESYLGPTYYSFNRGRWHFVVLNVYETAGKDQFCRLDEVQLNWLKADLAATGGSTPCVVFMHEELAHLANRQEVLEILGKYNIKAVVSGHFHSNMDFQYQGIRCIVTGALCAGWWWRDQWATPRGYGLFRINGDELSYFYAKCGDPNTVHILQPEGWSVVGGKVELVVAVLETAGAATTVSCRMGERDFVAMTKVHGGPWPKWTCKFDSREIPDASVRLEVRTVNHHGRTEIYHRHVVIKNDSSPIGTTDGELFFTVKGSKAASEVHLNGEKIGTIPYPTGEEAEAAFPLPARLVQRTNTITFIPAKLPDGGGYDSFTFKDLRISYQGRDYFRTGFRPHLFSPVCADRDDPRAKKTDIPVVIPPPEQAETMVLSEH